MEALLNTLEIKQFISPTIETEETYFKMHHIKLPIRSVNGDEQLIVSIER